MIISPLCVHGDLQMFIDRRKAENKPLPQESILIAIRQLVSVFAYAQALGISHRDIKPTNIYIDRDSRLKVGDFEDCSIEELNKTNSLSIVGSPYHLSPILRRNCHEVSIQHNAYKSDVYSLGLTVLELCALKRNPDYMNLDVSKDCIMRDIEELQYSPELKFILSTMLTHDEMDRDDFLQLKSKMNDERLIREGSLEWSLSINSTKSYPSVYMPESELQTEVLDTDPLYAEIDPKPCFYCQIETCEIVKHCCKGTLHWQCLIEEYGKDRLPKRLNCRNCGLPIFRCTFCNNYFDVLPDEVCKRCEALESKLRTHCRVQCLNRSCSDDRRKIASNCWVECDGCKFNYCAVCKQGVHRGKPCSTQQRELFLKCSDNHVATSNVMFEFCEKNGETCVVCLKGLGEVHSICEDLFKMSK